jgi:hypothetical protein
LRSRAHSVNWLVIRPLQYMSLKRDMQVSSQSFGRLFLLHDTVPARAEQGIPNGRLVFERQEVVFKRTTSVPGDISFIST